MHRAVDEYVDAGNKQRRVGNEKPCDRRYLIRSARGEFLDGYEPNGHFEARRGGADSASVNACRLDTSSS